MGGAGRESEIRAGHSSSGRAPESIDPASRVRRELWHAVWSMRSAAECDRYRLCGLWIARQICRPYRDAAHVELGTFRSVIASSRHRDGTVALSLESRFVPGRLSELRVCETLVARLRLDGAQLGCSPSASQTRREARRASSGGLLGRRQRSSPSASNPGRDARFGGQVFSRSQERRTSCVASVGKGLGGRVRCCNRTEMPETLRWPGINHFGHGGGPSRSHLLARNHLGISRSIRESSALQISVDLDRRSVCRVVHPPRVDERVGKYVITARG